jgi:superoxide dismutase, Fe-Mn family
MLSRRDMLRVAGAAAVSPVLFATAKAQPPAAKGPFTLPNLPYAVDALEPHVDAKTMEIHHDRHHAAYVTNLNAAVAGTDWASKPLEEILAKLSDVPEAKRNAVRNNGGGHWNHTFFWEIMAKSGSQPKGDLLKAIDASFGSLDGFKKLFKDAATKQFGSGWAWLVPGKDKPLAIETSANQDNPLMKGGPKPILGVDVWEHAYYLKYQNKRADYVDAWFNVVNWDKAAANYDAAKKG